MKNMNENPNLAKTVILCADDYGQNAAISQAIIELIKKNRLSATSCMVTSPDWLTQAKQLNSFNNQLDIGLHFNLTEGNFLSTQQPLFSLPELMIKSYA